MEEQGSIEGELQVDLLEMDDQVELEREQLSFIHTPDVSPIASRPSTLDVMDVNCLRPGQVYTLPEGEQVTEQISPRTRNRAKRINLPPQQ